MRKELENGFLDISPEVFSSICGYAATSCFGVKGMAPASVTDGLVNLLRRDNISHGVRVSEAPGGAAVELHIVVKHGINITEICRSIINAVKYNVENMTGIPVAKVDVFVDSVMSD